MKMVDKISNAIFIGGAVLFFFFALFELKKGNTGYYILEVFVCAILIGIWSFYNERR